MTAITHCLLKSRAWSNRSSRTLTSMITNRNKHDYTADVDKDLDSHHEFSIQQQKKTGRRYECHHETHGAVHG